MLSPVGLPISSPAPFQRSSCSEVLLVDLRFRDGSRQACLSPGTRRSSAESCSARGPWPVVAAAPVVGLAYPSGGARPSLDRRHPASLSRSGARGHDHRLGV